MPPRRRPSSPIRIETAAEYRKALAELAVLQKAPLGSAQTEGLQELVEAILDYEEKLKRTNGNGHVH